MTSSYLRMFLEKNLKNTIAETSYCEHTSPIDINYNCIAWAAEDNRRWWWPIGRYYWPSDCEKSLNPEVFANIFLNQGYCICEDPNPEGGFTKIALFALHGRVTHAARQLANGKWTSKLGQNIDISHDLSVVSGDVYGEPVLYLKREIREI